MTTGLRDQSVAQCNRLCAHWVHSGSVPRHYQWLLEGGRQWNAKRAESRTHLWAGCWQGRLSTVATQHPATFSSFHWHSAGWPYYVACFVLGVKNVSISDTRICCQSTCCMFKSGIFSKCATLRLNTGAILTVIELWMCDVTYVVCGSNPFQYNCTV